MQLNETIDIEYVKFQCYAKQQPCARFYPSVMRCRNKRSTSFYFHFLLTISNKTGEKNWITVKILYYSVYWPRSLSRTVLFSIFFQFHFRPLAIISTHHTWLLISFIHSFPWHSTKCSNTIDHFLNGWFSFSTNWLFHLLWNLLCSSSQWCIKLSFSNDEIVDKKMVLGKCLEFMSATVYHRCNTFIDLWAR